MNMIKTLYLRRSDQLLTEEEIFDSIMFAEDLGEDLIPKNWIRLKNIVIHIPDSLINDIIRTNTGIELDKKIQEHEAAIARLKDSMRMDK